VLLSQATTFDIGRIGELYVLKYVLPGAEDMAGKDYGHPFDQLFEGLRFNTKWAKLKKKKTGLYWRFSLHDHHDRCDFFVLCGYEASRGHVPKLPKRVWIIPSDAEEVKDREYLWVYVNNQKLNQYERQVKTK
jgi:hypothetical protein